MAFIKRSIAKLDLNNDSAPIWLEKKSEQEASTEVVDDEKKTSDDDKKSE